MTDTAHNYILELHYTCTPTGLATMAHVSRAYVRVDAEVFTGEPFDSIGLITGNGLDQTLEDLTTDYLGAIDNLFPAATDFGRWELWKQPVGTKDRVWIATKEIGTNGVATPAARPAGMATWTFRTRDGKYMKITFMETSFTADQRTLPPYTGDVLGLANIIRSATQSFTNVHNATAVDGNIAFSPGQNEEIYKKRFRS